jgi:hypothetical protein
MKLDVISKFVTEYHIFSLTVLLLWSIFFCWISIRLLDKDLQEFQNALAEKKRDWFKIINHFLFVVLASLIVVVMIFGISATIVLMIYIH